MCQCELLKPEIIAYIFSLAFQVSGAILLIVQYWGRTEARIITEYFPGNNFVFLDKTQIITMKKEKVQKCVRIVYHNRMSFLYIAFGYILSIWGNPLSACKICILFLHFDVGM